MEGHIPVDAAEVRVEGLTEGQVGAVVAEGLVVGVVVDLHGDDVVSAEDDIGCDVDAGGGHAALVVPDRLAVDVEGADERDALEFDEYFPARVGRIEGEVFAVPTDAVVGAGRPKRIRRRDGRTEEDPFAELVIIPGVRK